MGRVSGTLMVRVAAAASDTFLGERFRHAVGALVARASGPSGRAVEALLRHRR